MNLDLVIQEDSMGCGISCVAFAINDSYQNAKMLFTHPEYAGGRGYYCKEIIHTLNKKGMNYSFAKVSDKNKKLIDRIGSIVFIKR